MIIYPADCICYSCNKCRSDVFDLYWPVNTSIHVDVGCYMYMPVYSSLKEVIECTEE